MEFENDARCLFEGLKTNNSQYFNHKKPDRRLKKHKMPSYNRDTWLSLYYFLQGYFYTSGETGGGGVIEEENGLLEIRTAGSSMLLKNYTNNVLGKNFYWKKLI